MSKTTEDITLQDLDRAPIDAAVSKKVFAEITKRRATNPAFGMADLRRELAGELQPPASHQSYDGPVTLEDLNRGAVVDVVAARKVMAEVSRRRAKDPTFNVQTLRRELESRSGSATHRATAGPNGGCTECDCEEFQGADDAKCERVGCWHAKAVHTKEKSAGAWSEAARAINAAAGLATAASPRQTTPTPTAAFVPAVASPAPSIEPAVAAVMILDAIAGGNSPTDRHLSDLAALLPRLSLHGQQQVRVIIAMKDRSILARAAHEATYHFGRLDREAARGGPSGDRSVMFDRGKSGPEAA